MRVDRGRVRVAFTEGLGRALGETFGIQLLVAAIGLWTAVLLARWLGAEARGELEAVRAYSLAAAALGSLSIQQAIRFYGPRHRALKGSIAGTALILGSALGACQAAIIALLAEPLLGSRNPELVGLGQIYAVTVPAAFVLSYILAVHQSYGAFRRWYILLLADPCLKFGGLLTLNVLGRVNLRSVVFMLIGTSIILTFASLLGCRIRTRGFRRISRSLIFRGGRFTLPTISQTIFDQAVRIVPVWLLAGGALGNFAVSVTLAAQIGIIVSPFATIGFSEISGKTGAERIQTFLRLCHAAQLGIVALTLLLLLGLPLVVNILLTSEYASVITLGRVLAIGAACEAFTKVTESLLRAMDIVGPGVQAGVGGTLILLTLSLGGYSVAGPVGLASAFVFSSVLRAALVSYRSVEYLGLPRGALNIFTLKRLIRVLRPSS